MSIALEYAEKWSDRIHFDQNLEPDLSITFCESNETRDYFLTPFTPFPGMKTTSL